MNVYIFLFFFFLSPLISFMGFTVVVPFSLMSWSYTNGFLKKRHHLVISHKEKLCDLVIMFTELDKIVTLIRWFSHITKSWFINLAKFTVYILQLKLTLTIIYRHSDRTKLILLFLHSIFYFILFDRIWTMEFFIRTSSQLGLGIGQVGLQGPTA
jgi:hypothetical protein